MAASVTVLQLLWPYAFDACIWSCAAWSECMGCAQRSPELATSGNLLLYSTAIVDLDATGGEAKLIDTNIPWLRCNGYAMRVTHLVVNVQYGSDPGVEGRVYDELPRIIVQLIGIPEATAATATNLLVPGLPVRIACLLDTALPALSNLQAILVPRAEIGHDNPSTEDAPSHVSYCTTWGMGHGHPPPAVVLQCDVARIESHPYEAQCDMLLSVTMLRYLSARAPPLDMLVRLVGALQETVTACAHPQCCAAAQHDRRHLYVSPGRILLKETGERCAYDWCQLVLTQVYTPL
ncbi:hypothetical protein H4R19_004823 [Coemansia spiralis]|nr:hypothetical protein H4R19_004823 [Coemansia spiralis]